MNLLLRLVPAWVPAALILLATLVCSVLLHQRQAARLDAAMVRATMATMQAQTSEAARMATAAYRELEQASFARVQEAQRVLDTERAKNRRIAADMERVRTERDGLRDQIATYAGGGDASGDTVTAARDRADTLGRLLSESLRVQGELAADAESEAANVRALLSAWPK